MHRLIITTAAASLWLLPAAAADLPDLTASVRCEDIGPPTLTKDERQLVLDACHATLATLLGNSARPRITCHATEGRESTCHD